MKVRRGIFFGLWALSLVGAFTAGLQFAKPSPVGAEGRVKVGAEDVAKSVAPAVTQPGATTIPALLAEPRERPAIDNDLLTAVMEGGDAAALARYLEAADFATKERFVAAINTWLRSGRLRDAIEMLTVYLANEPLHAQAQFALSDAWQMRGQWRSALEPLFSVLRNPPTAADGNEAQLRSQQLINAREQQLLNVGDIAGLVGFFEWLTRIEPGNDAHRLSLVRWLLRSEDIDAAQRVFNETGNVGITEAARRALGDEIMARQTRIPVERDGSSLYVTLSLAGDSTSALQQVRLLIDTGSSMTSMAPAVLQRLRARKLNNQIEVQTASSSLLADVYRVFDVQIGGVRIGTLDVLELPELPSGIDGLLGMDVLSRLGDGVPKGVGRL